MDRGKHPSELLARAFDLCRVIREFAAEEKRLANGGESGVERLRGGAGRFEGDLDNAAKELVRLVDETGKSPVTGAEQDRLKVEIGLTIESVEDAVRTVREAKEAIQSQHSDALNRDKAIRAYQR